jgi:hypothetical protein
MELESLLSEDAEQFAAFVDDLKNGRSVIRKMSCKGKDALWVYLGFEAKFVYSLLIVPYDDLTALADDTENQQPKKNLE